jgi:hypothetical protein
MQVLCNYIRRAAFRALAYEIDSNRPLSTSNVLNVTVQTNTSHVWHFTYRSCAHQ